MLQTVEKGRVLGHSDKIVRTKIKHVLNSTKHAEHQHVTYI